MPCDPDQKIVQQESHVLESPRRGRRSRERPNKKMLLTDQKDQKDPTVIESQLQWGKLTRTLCVGVSSMLPPSHVTIKVFETSAWSCTK